MTGSADPGLLTSGGGDLRGGAVEARGEWQRDRRALLTWVGLVVAAAVAARLPLIGRPVSRDEAGFLMVAEQWAPGRSLYGDHWVDRPPLIIGFFSVADRLGGVDALRLLGLLLVAVAVVAAAATGWLAAGGATRVRTSVLCAATAAVFLATPLFGTYEVNGELIAVPLVLTGAALLLAVLSTSGAGPRRGLLLAAGVVGAAAVLVKQNQWDVVVLAAALLVAGHRSHGPGRVGVRDAMPFLAGAALTVVGTLAGAARLGTAPGELWQAVVVFRVQAAAVIGTYAGPVTSQRLADLVVAFALSGAPLLLLALVSACRCGPAAGALDLRLPALAVLAWESVAVLGGASYWPHYLICFVPGLVLATAVATTRPAVERRRRVGLVAPAWALAACLLSVAWASTQPTARPQDDLVAWLRANAAPGDDALVAYGFPDILHEAGLRSPYPDLWSLPVRVRDPDLADLGALLSGPRAPDWVVLTAPTLSTWGVDARAGEQALREHYVEAVVVRERWTVYRLDAGPPAATSGTP